MAQVKSRTRKAGPLRVSPASAEEFPQHAQAVFQRIHAAMTGLVQSLPTPVPRAVDLQKELEVYQPLAWRVFKIASVSNVLQVAKFIPSAGEIDTLIDASRKKGVPVMVTDNIRTAMDAYLDLLHAHAGNREGLRAMVAALASDSPAVIDEKCRKLTFQQQSLIWGQQCQVEVACMITDLGSRPGARTDAYITGRAGFHEMRAGVADEIQATVLPHPLPTEPASPGTVAPQIEFLRDFCSPGLSINAEENREHFINTKIKLPGLGKRAAVDYFQLFTGTSDEGEGERLSTSKAISIPAAMIHIDLIAPASAKPRVMRAAVYGRPGRTGRQLLAERPADLMPVEITGMYLGQMTDVPAAPGVPRYPEMVRSVLERQGWYGTKFDLYRCRFAFPIMHSLVSFCATATNNGG